ncbi:MAG: accessory gene regulator B family protein [Clostridium sp.]|nr:MAG: accessory gene regulator B family protein [Clostridium sp.]
MSLVFLFYGILRLTGFGLHAKNTKECWIISLLILVPFPYLLKSSIDP